MKKSISCQSFFEKVFNMQGCVSKIAALLQALALSVGSWGLPMCAMWVGFLSSFFAGGRKKQNKFPSNLHCPIKKLNPFLF
jgi:hypothetical protein